MTINELYESVAQLGFEDSLDESGKIRFVQAANRSILQVNSLRPIKNTFTLNHLDPSAFVDTYVTEYERDEAVTFSGDHTKAIYFEVCGEGTATIVCHKRTRKSLFTEEWDDTYVAADNCDKISFSTSGFVPIKRIIKFGGKYISELVQSNLKEEEAIELYTGTVLIKFEGECLYSIRNLAMYHTITSSDPERLVPYTQHIPYDFTKLVPDFDHFKTPPLIILDNRMVSNGQYAILGGNILLLPISNPGAYTVEYLCKPMLIDANMSDKTAIGLDDDLCALLPLLIASYIWLDDEPEKAQYYYNMYTQRAAEVTLATRGDTQLPFMSVNGW